MRGLGDRLSEVEIFSEEAGSGVRFIIIFRGILLDRLLPRWYLLNDYVLRRLSTYGENVGLELCNWVNEVLLGAVLLQHSIP